ncbi:DoxX family protein [Saccharopolyspora griseoalba]|uniref:DoxX family protein n=1 Tax=Saccharopolyspora griseoalba TaxID=1431848 RepID=A0ABW2LFX0_9PSEU
MQVLRDFFLIIGRIGIGVILIAHGWQKLVTNGVPATARGFRGMGVPAPEVAAWYATVVELAGGVLLILGLLMPLVGIAVAVDMAGAIVFVHLEHGLFSPMGFELPLAIGVATLALGFSSGRAAVDHALFSRLGRRKHAETETNV